MDKGSISEVYAENEQVFKASKVKSEVWAKPCTYKNI